MIIGFYLKGYETKKDVDKYLNKQECRTVTDTHSLSNKSPQSIWIKSGQNWNAKLRNLQLQLFESCTYLQYWIQNPDKMIRKWGTWARVSASQTSQPCGEHPAAAGLTFSSAHGTFSLIDHMLGHLKQVLINERRLKSYRVSFPLWTESKNIRRKAGRSTDKWKLNGTY